MRRFRLRLSLVRDEMPPDEAALGADEREHGQAAHRRVEVFPDGVGIALSDVHDSEEVDGQLPGRAATARTRDRMADPVLDFLDRRIDARIDARLRHHRLLVRLRRL